MSFTKSLPFLAFILTSIHAATFTVTNQCREPIWGAAEPSGGQRIDPGQPWTLNVNPGTMHARIWGRTGCNFDENGHGSCVTGDCGEALVCSLSGQPPLTLAEFSLNGDYNLDSYDISVIDGFNVGMSFSPTNTACPSLTCADKSCPDAYHQPGDRRTNTCPSGTTDYNIVFCP